jgi:hypothetical protein
MSPRDAETTMLLEKFERVPHLLELGRREAEQSGGDRYAIMKRLAQEHREQQRPFLLSMPMRHMESCDSREHRFGAVSYELVVPQGRGLFGARERSVKFSERVLHEVREHFAPFTPELAKLIRSLP